MSNVITTTRNNLPSTMEDLSKFVLIGREKLVAVRAEIRAINKVGLAKDVREQKLREAQDIADAVLDAEVRIGELMKQVPKATKGTGANQYSKPDKAEITTDDKFSKKKSEVIREAGFTTSEVNRFETLASHPDIVEQVKAEARESDDIVTRSAVLNKIKENKQAEHVPHVVNNSGNNEWYTPKEYIDIARAVLGEIDLDPASCEYANKTVKAKQYYSAENDGLTKPWKGKVWMNPPYSSDLISKFTAKFATEYITGNITEGIVLVNNATETGWFSSLVTVASAVAFPHGRIRYVSPDKETNTPLQGQAFIYFGNRQDAFCKEFSSIAWCADIRNGGECE